MSPQAKGLEHFDEVMALVLKSVGLRQEQHWDEALACLDEAAKLNPLLAFCQVERAQLLAHLQRYEDALDAIDFYLRYAPSSPVIEQQRCDLLQQAFAALSLGQTTTTTEPACLLQRANLLRKTGRCLEALDEYAAVLALVPDQFDALNNRGLTLLALNRHHEALAAFAAAIAFHPQRAELFYNRGNILQQIGCFEAARAAYAQALTWAPDLAEAQVEIAHCWLAEGNGSVGWPLYEWRWQTAHMKERRLPTERPIWLGEKVPAASAKSWRIAEGPSWHDKTLLVWAEQGAGDTLQFIRYVPDLLAKFGRVVLRVQPSLRELLQHLHPDIVVVGSDEDLPAHDVHCPLMSLPLVANPVSAPYLHADKVRMDEWAQWLGPKKRPRVGIVWSGRQTGRTDRTRDVPLSVLVPMFGMDVQWISLQKELGDADAQVLAGQPQLADCRERLQNFAATAALIENLDWVISVDTSVAHLAGALGKRCWLMLRYASEWRWQRERSDSFWYPALKIFRQPAFGDWERVVSRIKQELSVEVKNERE